MYHNILLLRVLFSWCQIDCKQQNILIKLRPMLRHPNVEFENQPFEGISQNGLLHYRECLRTFPRTFNNISRNIWHHSPDCWRHSLECFRAFPRLFGDISGNVSWNYPECLATFSRMFEDIPRNISQHSWECLRTLPGMF